MSTLLNERKHPQHHQLSAEQLYDSLEQAVELHRGGQWREAEMLYRSILEADPTQANASHNLGILALDAGQVNESLDYFKTALANDQDEPQFWVSYVDALIRANLKELATKVLMDGLERGLHGDEVNALVNQLTQSNLQAFQLNQEEPAEPPQAATEPSPAAADEANSPPKKARPKDYARDINQPQMKQAFECLQMGKLALAKGRFTKLKRYFPNHPLIFGALGVIALQQGQIQKSISLLAQSIALDPQQTTTLSSLSIAYTHLGLYDKAIACGSEAIAINPGYAEAYVNRANAYQACGRYVESIRDYRKAAELKPHDASIYFNLGLTYRHLKNTGLAAACFHKAVELNPNDILALEHCGESYAMNKQYHTAMPFIEQALALNPGNINNMIRRGAVHLQVGDLALAVTDFQEAIARAPDDASAYINMALVHRKRNQYQSAIEQINVAYQLSPHNVNIYLNRGLIHADMLDFASAEADYQQGLQLEPDHPDLHWNLAILYLLRGDYTQGWSRYEWRWQSILKEGKREFAQALWLGESSIAGKTLLVYLEQGLGDFIQFCRYIPILESMGAKVILETPKALVPMASTLSTTVQIIEEGATLPPFDLQCPMMSLPLALNTTLETVPTNIPYLHVNADKQQAWQTKLGEKTKPRVGLVWSGSLAHKNDHNRSLRLQQLAPIFSLDIAFHVLQKEVRAHDLEYLRQHAAITTHGESLVDFSDTAALIEAMDVVISVDTSVAHLAGALNKPCWVLLPYAPDFRWLLNRDDSPWYPSIRLFRQQQDRDWNTVMAKVQAALRNI